MVCCRRLQARPPASDGGRHALLRASAAPSAGRRGWGWSDHVDCLDAGLWLRPRRHVHSRAHHHPRVVACGVAGQGGQTEEGGGGGRSGASRGLCKQQARQAPRAAPATFSQRLRSTTRRTRRSSSEGCRAGGVRSGHQRRCSRHRQRRQRRRCRVGPGGGQHWRASALAGAHPHANRPLTHSRAFR